MVTHSGQCFHTQSLVLHAVLLAYTRLHNAVAKVDIRVRQCSVLPLLSISGFTKSFVSNNDGYC